MTRGHRITVFGRAVRESDLKRVHQIMEMVDAAGGPGAFLRARELDQGSVLIKPGSKPWFPAEDWPSGNQIVGVRNHEVRLVAIIAARPRSGAFGRLCCGIVAADLTPVVIQPIAREMVEILKHWRWSRSYVRRSGETEEQWRPGHDWMMATVRANRGGEDGRQGRGGKEGGEDSSREQPAIRDAAVATDRRDDH